MQRGQAPAPDLDGPARVQPAAAPEGARLRPSRRGRGFTEIAVLVALGVVYTLIRSRWGTDAAAALAHAHRILHAEGAAFRHVELPLNRWLVGVPLLAVPACYFYALMHYAMTPLVLLASRHRGGTQYWRGYWAIVIASAIALVGYATFPAAPPRLVPDIGITDVMAHFSHYGWWGSAASAPRGIGDATNQFAAMPSLHFGWSLWCGIQMWGLGGPWWRTAAVLYPALQVLVVLGTGNHFLLDVVGGGLCVLVAYAVVVLVQRGLRRRAAGVPVAA